MRASVLCPVRAGLLLGVALLMGGCASLAPAAAPGRHQGYTPPVAAGPEREERAGEEAERLHRRRGLQEQVTRVGSGSVAAPAGHTVVVVTSREDAWEQLLTSAGLEERDERPVPGSPLTPTRAARLMEVLLSKPVTRGTFPSRMGVGYLLRRVLETGELSRQELLGWVKRLRRVAVLRPDGYLAWVWDGRTQQKTGPVQWKDGAFRAYPFELGRFYVSNGWVFRLADEQLEPLERPVLVEVYDDADYLSRSLDGAEAAFVALALAVGELLTHPVDSLVALKDLPAGVAALIAASPEYLERFRYMTRGEQVEAVAELVTTLLVTKGTASSTTRTMTGALVGAEATVPVLALSADGALVLERVALPVAQAARAVSGGPGAALLLHRANTGAGAAAPSGGRGPGEWGPAEEAGMSKRSRAYQEQISGHSADEAYWVGGVGKKSGGTKFDGFENEVLLEAKGPGYADKFLDSLKPEPWFEPTGAQGLIEQAQRQCERVRGTGLRIEWHVAEEKAANAIRKLFQGKNVDEITVIHTPPK